MNNAYKLEVARRAVQILANVLTLGAVGMGMYQASFFPDETLSVFSLWFFSLLAVILFSSWLAMRLLSRVFPVEAHNDFSRCSVVNLPGKGPCLVRWEVVTPQWAIRPRSQV